MTNRRKVIVTGGTLLACVLIGTMIGFRAYQSSRARNEMRSSSRMKMISQALFIFMNDHRAEFPNTLPEIKPYLERLPPNFPFIERLEFDYLMSNPLTGDFPGYEYVKPNLDVPESEFNKAIILFQLRDGKRATDLPVALGDGSVRRLNEP